eukprot:290889-Pelagomonas_calceolata.AAC.1
MATVSHLCAFKLHQPGSPGSRQRPAVRAFFNRGFKNQPHREQASYCAHTRTTEFRACAHTYVRHSAVT